MSTIDIVRKCVGSRHRITYAEMESILKAIHAEGGEDSLANSYVERSFDAQSKQPWLAWLGMLRGITLICVDGNLRDGNVRYDQPGTMAPGQHAAVIFARREGHRPEAIEYLRTKCDRLLLVADIPQEVFLPPGVQMRLASAGRRGPYRLPAPDAAALQMLWDERNSCDEWLVSGVDDRMTKLVLRALGDRD